MSRTPGTASPRPTCSHPIPRVDSRLVRVQNSCRSRRRSVLDPVGGNGISSIRCITRHGGFLLALFVDIPGASHGLISCRSRWRSGKPMRIGDYSIWKKHGKMTNDNMLTPGRPTSIGQGTVSVVAHFEGGFEVQITIQDQGREFRLGEMAKTRRVVIEVVKGTDMIASYLPRTDFAELPVRTEGRRWSAALAQLTDACAQGEQLVRPLHSADRVSCRLFLVMYP